MPKTLARLLTLIALIPTVVLNASHASVVMAAPTGITNPAVPKLNFTPKSAEDGTSFISYFALIWQAIQLVGGLMVLFYFLWGGLEWIMSHGEKSKVEAARNKMLQAVTGFIILMSTFVIAGFVGSLIGYDLINPVFGLPGSGAAQTGSPLQNKLP